MNRKFTITSPKAMEELGASFARNASSGDVFALVGPLGSGKTHWTKGFLHELQPETLVTSPTFSIVNEYSDGDQRIHHFDFYRLKSASELINLGWDDYLDDSSVVICEWANLFPELMPENALWLKFSHNETNTRNVEVTSRQLLDE